MHTLRVLLAAAPSADRADPWALIDASGRTVARGRDAPSDWPQAERREAVIAATAVRIVALSLPPLPPDRVASAATYALEERLATPMDASIVVAGPQAADGRVTALVASRSLARGLAESRPAFARIVAEPLLASPPAEDAWRWCASESSGFVLTADGDAFAVGTADGEALPAELAVAIEQAARRGAAPLRIDASVPDADAHRGAWTRASGVPFAVTPPWRWDRGEVAAPALGPAFARELGPAAAPSARGNAFAVALMLLAAAFALHVLATVGAWGQNRLDLARTRAQLVAAARDAGVAATDAGTAAQALAGLHATARHRNGMTVGNDAWPLLAQAAPALHALPAGVLRSARWAGGAWTLELAPLDDPALAAFDARLQRIGIAPVLARTSSGVRVRIEGARR